MQPIYIASDHAGFELKQRLVLFVKNDLQREIEDLGPSSYVSTDDYPDYVIPLAYKVVETKGRGIVICNNGIGVSIAVNKVPGIHAGVGYNLSVAETMMTDDNTNVLSLAAGALSPEFAQAIVKKWLSTEFSGAERHVRRLQKVDNI